MSKLMLFDFECKYCGTFEELVRSTEHSTDCPKCGAISSRMISPVRFDYRMGVSTGFPTMADKWSRMQEQKAKSDKGSLCDGAPNLKMY